MKITFNRFVAVYELGTAVIPVFVIIGKIVLGLLYPSPDTPDYAKGLDEWFMLVSLFFWPFTLPSVFICLSASCWNWIGEHGKTAYIGKFLDICLFILGLYYLTSSNVSPDNYLLRGFALIPVIGRPWVVLLEILILANFILRSTLKPALNKALLIIGTSALLFLAINVPETTDSSASVTEWQGVVAPDFTVITLDGQKITLSELKDKRVVLDFWATWCPPCRKEIPHFIQLTKDISSNDLRIVGISSEEVETLKKFAQKEGINYPIASANDNDLPAPYSDVRSIPTTFFIDRHGIIQTVVVGYHDLATLKSHAMEKDYEGEHKLPPAPKSKNEIPAAGTNHYSQGMNEKTTIATDLHAGKSEYLDLNGLEMEWSMAAAGSGYLYLTQPNTNNRVWNFEGIEPIGEAKNAVKVKDGDVVIATHISGRTFRLKISKQTDYFAKVYFEEIQPAGAGYHRPAAQPDP